jgi:hypothetical protein
VAAYGLFAAESVPYFQLNAYRSAWTSDGHEPVLHRADTIGELRAVPKEAVAIEIDSASPEVWADLKSRPLLEELHLRRGFAPELKELGGLKRILMELRGSEDAAVVAQIASLRPSEFLYLNFEHALHEDVLKFAQALPVIETPLRLFIGDGDGPRLPNALLEEFAKQTRLEFVHFASARFDSGAGKILAGWPALKYIYTVECPGFDNSTCSELAGSSSLEALNGINHAFDGAGLMALTKVKTLRHLGLKGIIKAQPAQIVAAFKKLTLESLDIEMEEYVDEAVFKQVMSMKTLQMLRLPVHRTIPDDTFEKLSSLKELRWLSLAGINDGRPFDAIPALKNLRHLYWSSEATAPVALFKKLPPKLVRLHLGMRALTEEHLKYLAKLESLQELRISATPGLSSKALLQLAEVKSLKRLYASWSDEAKSDFANARPDVDLGAAR